MGVACPGKKLGEVGSYGGELLDLGKKSIFMRTSFLWVLAYCNFGKWNIFER